MSQTEILYHWSVRNTHNGRIVQGEGWLMGYSTIRQVLDIMANALTSGVSAPQANGRMLLNDRDISTTFQPNNIDTNLIYQMGIWSDEQIDAALSEMYQTPLIEKTDIELVLLNDIDPYNSSIELNKAAVLTPGDVLLFLDEIQEERHIVREVLNENAIELEDALIGLYSASNTRVLRVKYPPSITLISARLTAATVFDKLFSAQVAPGVSEYGKHLRELARRDLNNILNGRTILHGQKRIGHRFFNPNLRDRYRLPGIEDTGQDRNIDPTNG